MNLHPILVHFPVALLTMYAVAELASLVKPIRERAYVFYVKASLLLLGAAAAVPTFITGFIQLGPPQPDSEARRLLLTHYHFAIATLIVFGLLALCYAAAWLTREWTAMPEAWKRRLAWHRYVTESLLAPALAVIGLGCVTVTGALGGAMVYGPGIDPAVTIIYNLLIKK
jgi:uncharacterized membrane protein